MENSDTNENETPRRPLGYWLRVVDGLLAHEFAASLDDADVSRRDWMLLNAVDSSVDTPWLAERLARKSGRVRRLADRGWIVEADGRWELTEAGRAEKDRLAALVDGMRERVSGAVSPEDFDTTLASLEAIARELGWDESADAGHRRHGFAGGFGPGFRDGFGGGHRGFGPGHRGFGRGHGHRGFGHGRDHGCGDHQPHGEQAYERGFTAGFERGRAAASAPVA
ncbi:MarR family winged helix-turn-helix transcriptional regulator [Microbacterium sp. P06]|uniref:MarR family winged helix-turn-helix transcriptional regulator n=1 Tax=Microbacterium sp. P06 TaxID=3366949 RepID=UPI003745C552